MKWLPCQTCTTEGYQRLTLHEGVIDFDKRNHPSPKKKKETPVLLAKKWFQIKKKPKRSLAANSGVNKYVDTSKNLTNRAI